MVDQNAELARTKARLIHHQIPVPIGPVTKESALKLKLHRLGEAAPGTPAVLVLHGANSSSDTFLLPNGGLATFLEKAGFDVWLLDWRGSPYVLPEYLTEVATRDPFDGNVFAECKEFTYDVVADRDLPPALDFVRRAIGPETPLSFVGHCVGGGITAIAVAMGIFDRFHVSHVVMMGLSLFYEVPWDGWVKVEDFILERILAEDKTCRSVDPRSGDCWPRPMKEAYDRWPSPWLPYGGRSTDELLRRLTFMFGRAWNPENLVDGLDGPILDTIFAPVHLGLFLHSGQMVRRGYAAPFEEIDLIDRGRLTQPYDQFSKGPVKDYLLPKHFRTKRITLVTGSENRVWHRDSMDLMYEWLRNLGAPDGRDRYRKHVAPGFGLQDLFWAKAANTVVWPHVRDGLQR